MSDLFPDGTPFSISERASASARLERAYRRLVAFYPQSFRRANTEEIIAVLLATAREGQCRPTVAEAADLLRGALRARLGLSRCPRTVLHAVRLMYLGALAEVAVLITMLVTAGSIRAAARVAAVRAIDAGQAHVTIQQGLAEVTSLVNAELTADAAIAFLGIAGFLFLGWANGKGHAAARPAALIACAFYTAAVALGLLRHDYAYGLAATLASCAVMAIGIAATVLLLMKQSWPYYERQPATR